jgi:hypothetical protein
MITVFWNSDRVHLIDYSWGGRNSEKYVKLILVRNTINRVGIHVLECCRCVSEM